MKNTTKSKFLYIGCALLFLSACQQKPKEEKTNQEPEDEKKEIVKPPEGIISLKESKSLYDNYSRNRAGIIKTFERESHHDENFDVARYTSFDFEEVKQYIAFVEQEAKKAKVDVSTFRFYFANYPSEEKFPDGKAVMHPRQNSIFIVPTINVDGKDFGFYIGADGKAKLINNSFKADQQGMGSVDDKSEKSYAGFAPSFFSSATLQGRQSLNFNRGSSGPPPPDDY